MVLSLPGALMVYAWSVLCKKLCQSLSKILVGNDINYLLSYNLQGGYHRTKLSKKPTDTIVITTRFVVICFLWSALLTG